MTDYEKKNVTPEGGRKVPKKCYVLFEWLLISEFVCTYIFFLSRDCVLPSRFTKHGPVVGWSFNVHPAIRVVTVSW
jgi:hypothetical protein